MEKFENKNKEETLEQKSFNKYIELFHLTEDDLKRPLLDVGAGRGYFIRFLRNNLGNFQAYGVENYEPKISSREEGMIVADGFKLPFPDESFELVLSKNYLPIFVEDENKMHEAIRELLRVTKFGGKVVGDISVPDGVMEDMEEYKNLEGYDKKIENWFVERYKASQKLLLFLDQLRKEGIVVKREGDIITLYKNPQV